MATNSPQNVPTRPPWHRDPKVRGIAIQVILVFGLLFFIYFLYSNTIQNLNQRNIKTGFAFLSMESGFGIIQSLVEYDETHSFGKTFVVGLLNTALVSILGIFFATILGFIMGIARLSKNWIVAKIARLYVESFRNIPLLVQILFWYSIIVKLPLIRESINLGDLFFINNRGINVPSPVAGDGFGYVVTALFLTLILTFFIRKWACKRQERTGQPFPLFYTSIFLIFTIPFIVYLALGSPLTWENPVLKGFNFKGGWVIIPELLALLFALTIYTGTYIAETVRAGIQAVQHGQTEAARALGLKDGLTIRLIVMPQAMKVIIPPLTSQYLNLVKNSSLATAIGYPDLFAVFAGTTLNQTGQAIEIIAMTMCVYLIISLSISFLMNIYNRKVTLVER